MSKVKKIIGSFLEGSAEVFKKGAQELVDTVSPGSLIDSALGTPKKNEITDYLQNLADPTLTAEKLAEKAAAHQKTDEAEKAKILGELSGGLAPHMKTPPKPAEQSAYDAAFEEMLRSQTAKKQGAPQAVMAPTGKMRGNLRGKKISGGMEITNSEGGKKDTKIG